MLPAFHADLLAAPRAAPPALHRNTSEGTKHGPLITGTVSQAAIGILKISMNHR